MSEILIISIILNVFLGGLAILLSLREEVQTKELHKLNTTLTRRLYELTNLYKITEKIEANLSIKAMAETLSENIQNYFKTSVVCYGLISQATITIYPISKEINHNFLTKVKDVMLASIYELINTHSEYTIVENWDKNFVNSQTIKVKKEEIIPLSYFNIPLVVNNKVAGVITVASYEKGAYKESDIVSLYTIVKRSTEVLSSLERIVKTEKGKLDSLIMSLPSGAMLFVLKDGVLKLSTINSAASEYLKIGRQVDTRAVITALSMNIDLIQQIKGVVTGKKSIFLKDVKVNERYFKIFINPVFLYETEEAIGISITMQDITTEKEMQEIKENFTNMVVHELRAPLVSVKGATELLLKGNINPSDQEKLLGIVHDQTVRMINDISDLLDAAKIESGKFSIEKNNSDINQIIKEASFAFQSVARQKNIDIKLNQDPRILTFKFDNARIREVINNLISNAIKFSSDGEINISSTLEINNVKIKVVDQGTGIAQEKMPLLFTRYGQIPSAVSSDQGTGLGLFISKAIIESHGGKIWVESPAYVRKTSGGRQEGKGTSVYFTLPYLDPKLSQSFEPNVQAAIN